MNSIISGIRYSALTFVASLAIVGASIGIASAQSMTMQTASTTTTTTSASSSVTVQIMTHLCGSTIKNATDFEALEANRSPVAALANTVLNCPATGLPLNAAVAGAVAAPRTTYDFQVVGSNSGTQTLSANALFYSHKLCESDLNLDVNGDGTVSSSTCLDISHYQMPSVTNTVGTVHVVENNPPAGYHFGVVRFTPPALDNNNDAVSLRAIDPSIGTIILDPMNDVDHTIMLHVYNFVNQTPVTPTPTPPLTQNCTINSNLTVGSSGSDVDCLQTYLIAQGYLSIATPTDYFGALTKSALKSWQSAAGINATGYFGPISMSSFNSR